MLKIKFHEFVNWAFFLVKLLLDWSSCVITWVFLHFFFVFLVLLVEVFLCCCPFLLCCCLVTSNFLNDIIQVLLHCCLGPLALLYVFYVLLFGFFKLLFMSSCITIHSFCYLSSWYFSPLDLCKLGTRGLDAPLSWFFKHDFQTMLAIFCFFGLNVNVYFFIYFDEMFFNVPSSKKKKVIKLVIF